MHRWHAIATVNLSKPIAVVCRFRNALVTLAHNCTAEARTYCSTSTQWNDAHYVERNAPPQKAQTL